MICNEILISSPASYNNVFPLPVDLDKQLGGTHSILYHRNILFEFDRNKTLGINLIRK